MLKLIRFIEGIGIIHKELRIFKVEMVNQHFCREVLERLRKRVACVTPQIKEKWMRCPDNAPCYTALSITEFSANNSILLVSLPPYSLNLGPCQGEKNVSKDVNFTP